jgi:hypothetical protein
MIANLGYGGDAPKAHFSSDQYADALSAQTMFDDVLHKGLAEQLCLSS